MATLIRKRKSRHLNLFFPIHPSRTPLHPFPPGSDWAKTLEMLEEILNDLQIPWVQDFILRSEPKTDVHAFSDRHNQSRAISRLLHSKSISGVSGGFTSTVSRVRLHVPVISIDSIGVGIAVTKTEDKGAGDYGYLKTLEFSHFVSNRRTNSELIITIHEELDQVSKRPVESVASAEVLIIGIAAQVCICIRTAMRFPACGR